MTPGTPHLFAVVSWGCAATHWLAKVLNAHPEILCLHAGRKKLNACVQGEIRDEDYRRILLNIGSGYSAIGDVHGTPIDAIEAARETFGAQFTPVVLVREPIAQLKSALALYKSARVSGRDGHYNLDYISSHADSLGIVDFRDCEERLLFLRGANALNSILSEQSIGTIYRCEDLFYNPEGLVSLAEEVSGGLIQPSREWAVSASQIPPLASHRKEGKETRFSDWEIAVLRKLVNPQSWILYSELGYETPEFLQ